MSKNSAATIEKFKKIIKALKGKSPTLATHAILSDIRALKEKYNIKK